MEKTSLKPGPSPVSCTTPLSVRPFAHDLSEILKMTSPKTHNQTHSMNTTPPKPDPGVPPPLHHNHPAGPTVWALLWVSSQGGF